MSLRLKEALMTTTNIKLNNTMYSLHKLDVCGKKFITQITHQRQPQMSNKGCAVNMYWMSVEKALGGSWVVTSMKH
jgi:hypothetical protein